MTQSPLMILGLLVTMAGCGSTAIGEPVTASTGSAISSDGYDAALATAEADGYPVVMKDPSHSFLRLRARALNGPDSETSVTFDVKAWKGSVDVLVKVPPGLRLAESQIRQIHSERKELAWAISKRARMIAGEPFGDVEGVSSDAHILTAKNYDSPIIFVPSGPP